MKVSVLGCGSATPTLRHQPSSQVINHRERLFMIDCGEGAQLQFKRMGLKFSRLGHIFISHLHGDHLFGLPGLLSTMDLHGTGGEVIVHIHPEGIKMLRPLLAKFLYGDKLRVIFNPLTPDKEEVIYDDKNLVIRTFPLNHRIPSNGFRIEEKPGLRHIKGEMVKFYEVPISQMQALKEGNDYVTAEGKIIPNDWLTADADTPVSYAYCSDTSPSPGIIKAVEGVNLLYHEATYDNSLKAQALERGHSTAREAAEVAQAAAVGQLMIGHYSKRYLSEEGLLKEAQEVFPNTILANEGKVVDIC